ncbi:nitrate reductase associated protein [Dyadobacter luteus]|jgi:hypothetical protein|nr:nitrate reductase associated protein [Dyadobacter luteus]
MTIHPVATFFFGFESDFVSTLKCVPMIVRYKLDSCGVKLKLHEWAKFSLADKELLATLPCFQTDEIKQYENFVRKLVKSYFGYEASTLTFIDDNWNNISEVPIEIHQKAKEWECPGVSLKEWINLNTLQRFALVKLSRSGHEGKNFPVALREFGVV